MDIKKLTIKTAREGLDKGDFSSVDLLNACIENAKKTEDLNIYLELYEDARVYAEKADKMIKEGNQTILTGIPFAVKDNILFEGHVSSTSSKILENYKGTYSSFVMEKLLEMGAVPVGRTNMDEFAMGSSTETSAFGPTKNPLDPNRVPGGSSGGSAAALPAGSAIFSLGSDTGGSIRQPASYCGITGLKPTYGTVSRYGLMALGSSLDIIGPITKTPEDAEIVYKAISGYDKRDHTSYKEIDRQCDVSKVQKIGVLKKYMDTDGIQPEVKANFKDKINELKELGYEIVEIDVPYIEYSLPVYYIIMPAEASTNLSRYDGVRYGLSVDGDTPDEVYKKTKEAGFGKETKRRILLGTYVLSHGYYDAYYGKAIQMRNKITAEMKRAFEKVDLIMTPTTTTSAFEFGSKKDPVSMYLSDVFTVSANISGMPAISIPSGLDRNNMPLGLQFIADHFCEKNIFEVAKKLTQ